MHYAKWLTTAALCSCALLQAAPHDDQSTQESTSEKTECTLGCNPDNTDVYAIPLDNDADEEEAEIRSLQREAQEIAKKKQAEQTR